MKIPRILQQKALLSVPSDEITNLQAEHWITVAEAASLTNRQASWLIKQIEKGNLTGKLSDKNPVTQDGHKNYDILLEDLSSSVQSKYFISHLSEDTYLDQDFITPRMKLGKIWEKELINISVLIQEVLQIKREYYSSQLITEKLTELAKSYGISLSTLYRFTSQNKVKKMSLLYLDPVYMQDHLPYTMCLRSVDFVYALFLEEHKRYSFMDIYNELKDRCNVPCQNCPYYPSNAEKNNSIWKTPSCRKECTTMVVPNNPKTIGRVVSHIPPSVICYCRDGFREWRSEFAPFSMRFKPLMTNDLFQGDSHVFNIMVRMNIYQYKNNRRYTKEIVVRPVLTAWMDSASGVFTGWVISVLPDSDSIAEAFCRAAVFTVGEIPNALPHAVMTDQGKDFKSQLLDALPDEFKHVLEKEDNCYLNKRFAGLGILRALNVNVMRCLPFHPQSKPIEKAFSSLENHIEKLPGWCYRKVEDRPPGFMKHIQEIKDNKTMLTIQEFATVFATKILPAYHGSVDTDITNPDLPGWTLDLASMTPMQRYQNLQKSRTLIPSMKSLSILKRHFESNFLIHRQGVRFRYVYYDAEEMNQLRGQVVDILYFNVSKPFAPSSITIIYQNEYLCEAYPKGQNSYIDASEMTLSDISHTQNSTAGEIRNAVTQIRRNANAILPENYDSEKLNKLNNSEAGRKAQLKDMCYGAPFSDEKEEEYMTTDPALFRKGLDIILDWNETD